MKEYLEQSFMTVNKIFAENFNMSVSRDDQGSVEDLNNPPFAFIENLKEIQEVEEILIVLEFFFSEENNEFVRQYLNEIILDGEAPSNWRKGRILIPSVSLKDQMVKSFNEIYPNIDVSNLSVSTPSVNRWKQGYHANGAFIIKEPDSTYLSPTPENFLPIYEHEDTKTIAQEKRLIWFRRWIATRMARYFLSIDQLESFSDKNILYDIAPASEWTVDAVIAFEGLLKEQQEFGWKEGEIPGYVGPDSFYK